jgi:hypothetical protein
MDDGYVFPLETPSINFLEDSLTTSTSSSPLPTTTKILAHGAIKIPRNSTHKHDRHSISVNDPSRWRIPTILALTVAIGLGTALAIFLAIIAWRKVRKLRELQRRDAAMREIGR